jgi:3-methyl-2-oxobutanoate hydroxymethyltransferase
MRIRVLKFQEMKQRGEPIASVTAYDYAMAKVADAAGIPLILVGDSLGNVMLGYNSTVHVTMEDMLHHTKAVVRGTENALVAVDLPFMSYQVNEEEALRNAGRMLQEGGAQAVKLEGGLRTADTIARIVEAGIPVIGHIGLTPQSEHAFGGFRVQGTEVESARDLIEDALAVQEAGAFAVVIETVPSELGKLMTERLSIPTIGIGAGPHCDGQIQVLHDILGLSGRQPKHSKAYVKLHETITQAIASYAEEVRSGAFPTVEQGIPMDAGALRVLLDALPFEQ